MAAERRASSSIRRRWGSESCMRFTARSAWSRISRPLHGLTRNSCTPTRIACCAYWNWSYAVTIIQITYGWSRLTASISSSPVSPFIRMSENNTCMVFFSKIAMASSAEYAHVMSVISWMPLFSSRLAVPSHIIWSSSTINTFIGLSPFAALWMQAA